MSQVRKITFKQIVPVLLQCFLEALDNILTICLKVILRTRDIAR